MNRFYVYSLIVAVIAAGCLVMYLASRLLTPIGKARQNQIGLALVGLSVLAIAFFHTNLVASNCFVLSLALCVGMLISRMIGSNGALTSFLISASIADLISTQMGATKWLVDQAQNPQHLAQLHGVVILQYLALSIRMKGYLVPVIGFGDLMFFALCAFVASRFSWPKAAIFAVPFAGILAALGMALASGRLIPAIPLIAATVIAYTYMRSPGKRLPVTTAALKQNSCAL